MKRFFREDYVNLTKAAIDKDYILSKYKKEMESDLPHLLRELSKSQVAYREYLNKLKRSDDADLSAENTKKKGSPIKERTPVDPLSLVRPDSPTWRALKKSHKQPE